MRSVILITLSVLAAACALVEPPEPPGTIPFQAQVTNLRREPVDLTVIAPLA